MGTRPELELAAQLARGEIHHRHRAAVGENREQHVLRIVDDEVRGGGRERDGVGREEGPRIVELERTVGRRDDEGAAARIAQERRGRTPVKMRPSSAPLGSACTVT